jgi:5'/3'-nucleotidase SurE
MTRVREGLIADFLADTSAQLLRQSGCPRNLGESLTRLLFHAALCCQLLGVAAIRAVAQEPSSFEPEALSILLTNDDGIDALGITAMRDALLVAGHRVTVVAPLENQSGSAMRFTTSGVIQYSERSDGVWTVDASPADAVTLAVLLILEDDPPDLVVSGPNFGQNLGAGTNNSGTVGAALTASRMGYPAIAVSVGLAPGERLVSPAAFPSTSAAMVPAAEYTVGLITQLQRTRGDAGELLPARLALNVNYPVRADRAPLGTRLAPLSSVRSFRQVFSVSESGGAARVELTRRAPPSSEQGSDFDLFERGFITISVLDGDLGAAEQNWEGMSSRLNIEPN